MSVLVALSLLTAASAAQMVSPAIERVVDRLSIDASLIAVTGAPLPAPLTPPGCERLLLADLQEDASGWTTARFAGDTPESGSGVLVWRGLGEDVGGMLLGDDGRRWRIVSMEDGGSRLEIVDTDRLPPCADLPAPPALKIGVPAQLAACDDGKPIDVLVLYTAAARAQAGSKTAIEGQITAAIGAANTAYANSQIGARLNLVLQMETDYTSSDFGTDLWRLANPNDGFIDWAHQLRDTAGADMVALIRNDGEYCGIAYLMYSNGPESDGIPFSVTA
ncbi:MAG: zinc-dependent metalloprotease, partial [Planctomycetes bacterium]|nr:zinc-dependent metalloprotease [Planctomycetota bacterium]